MEYNYCRTHNKPIVNAGGCEDCESNVRIREKRTRSSEHEEQVALIEWADMSLGRYPELAYLHAIPNGTRTSIQIAKRMKQEGVRKGVPDLFLPVVVRYDGAFIPGLYIEMKYGKNKPSKEQKDFISFLRTQGYYVQVCYDMESAKNTIEAYLDLRDLPGGTRDPVGPYPGDPEDFWKVEGAPGSDEIDGT